MVSARDPTHTKILCSRVITNAKVSNTSTPARDTTSICSWVYDASVHSQDGSDTENTFSGARDNKEPHQCLEWWN